MIEDRGMLFRFSVCNRKQRLMESAIFRNQAPDSLLAEDDENFNYEISLSLTGNMAF